jgi:hypothetical protein
MDRRTLLGFQGIALFVMTLCACTTWGQTGDARSTPEQQLQQQINSLQMQIQQMKSELDDVRSQAAKNDSAVKTEPASEIEAHTNQPVGSDSTSVESLQEDLHLLKQEVDDEYQTKVESWSRYRVRLSGMFLINFFGNRGVADNIENPTLPVVQPMESQGNFGGTIRQTQLGLEVVGPDFLGARTSGDIHMDFAGGFDDSPGGATVGLPRLRTGTVRLDWKKTSLIAGQDGLFFSPLSPTSLASIEQPPLAHSGNLWAWVPQIRVEQHFKTFSGSEMTVEGGILDPISGELPSDGNSRNLGVGEASLKPALAAHIGWSKPVFRKPLSLGMGTFRSREYWQPSGAGTRTTSWLVSTDWDIPTSRWTSISGSFYRGQSVGVFGGGVGQDVIVSGTPGSVDSPEKFLGIDSMGGWAQLKIQPASKIEFNTAFGQDNPYADELRSQSPTTYAGAALFRNRAVFTNIIYRPRSDLLFSLELRHLHGVAVIDGSGQSANHVNLGMAILF